MLEVCEEVVVVDSGSKDATESIVKGFDRTRFVYHPLKSFKDQRIFASESCRHQWVFFLDSDEIPDEILLEEIQNLKANGFVHDAYKVPRYWNVLGKDIHSIYPTCSPDHPIRLINKAVVSFQQAGLVHETPTGFSSFAILKGSIRHITFQTKAELQAKLEFYTEMAAKDMVLKKKKITLLKRIFSPVGAFLKWYFLRRGYKDGWLGLYLGRYAYQYTQKKYQKAARMLQKP